MFLFYNSCLHAQTSYSDAISSHDSPVISEIVFTSIPFAIIALAIRTLSSALPLASPSARPSALPSVDDVLVIPFGNHILLVYKFRVPVELRDLACPEEPLEDIGPSLRLRLSIFPKIPESKYCKIFYTDSRCFSIKTPASLTIRP